MVIPTCIECGSLPKYKCPTCRQPYCSVNCCKRHKESSCSPPSIPEETQKETIPNYEFPTEDTVPVDKLKLLEESTDLKKCLENPHVREILEELDKSPQPDILMKKYMQEPIFTEFVDACLNVVQRCED
ncbi:zinc finger HIT domain-containing protein 3 [Zerene cesonia]|uniref:zinc finger HIT domain-containing protein 3 n=1 Tax=Zerene cesonia TaxID=33412 RepID=UPI0018E510F3|nr:zinc finger HIT domain-containing protein 3 [Zerene cesonia]